MASDYIGSIAQLYITFSAAIATSVVPGQNYYTVLLFMGSTEAAGAFSGSAPGIGTKTEVTAQTFSSLFKGNFLAQMTAFYVANSITKVIIVIYDDTTATASTFPAGAVTALTTQYNAYKDLGYFKLLTMVANIPGNSALATLCLADPLLSQCWISASDAQMLVPGSSTSQRGVCNLAGSDPVIVYHPDVTKNAALVQLGLSLAYLNTTGTPVGNSLDYIAGTGITPSGTAGANLSATDIATLEGSNSGYFLTIGNGTGQVACKGGKTIKGNVAAGLWVVQFVDFTVAVLVATYLTQYNRFRNNSTYQGILTILQGALNDFVEMGRLSDLKITAPSYQNLPASSGELFLVPNAWRATYNDNARKATVQGTLYVAA